MAQVFVKDNGLLDVLDAFIAWMATGTWRCALYTNDITPTKNTVYADFTASTVPGLDFQTMPYTGWAAAVIDTNQGLIEYSPPLVFQPTTMSGLPEDCYGWFFYRTTGPKLKTCERFTEMLHFTTEDDSLTLYPKIRSDDL